MVSRIIVFTRYPSPGSTKTRLIPLLGDQGAATLQARLAEGVIAVVRLFSQSCKVPVEIRYNGGSSDLMSQWLGDDLVYRRQDGGDLGFKMLKAFQAAFQEGCGRVVVVGSDLVGLTVAILEASFDLLTDHDLVLGPANDGGYYLLGLREPRPGIFQNITWGSGSVLQETIDLANVMGLSVRCVRALDDVDRPEDMVKLDLLKWFAPQD